MRRFRCLAILGTLALLLVLPMSSGAGVTIGVGPGGTIGGIQAGDIVTLDVWFELDVTETNVSGIINQVVCDSKCEILGASYTFLFATFVDWGGGVFAEGFGGNMSLASTGLGNLTNSAGYIDALPPITTLIPTGQLVYGMVDVLVDAPGAVVTLDAADPNGVVNADASSIIPLIVSTTLGTPDQPGPDPELAASKTVTLGVDLDGDGLVDPGDTLHYTVVITNSGLADAQDVAFTDTPGANSTLADNVTTTQGMIIAGNSAGDLTVEVDVGTLASGGGSATIGFDVVVDDPFPDSEDSISNQGSVSGSNFDTVATDDPDTGAPADPTVTPVSSALDRCVADLDACEGDLGSCGSALDTCESDLGQAEEDLAACQALDLDSDQDGIPDRFDSCADTPAGQAIDPLGCSLGQFCENLPGPAACNNGDWKNDEPLGNAQDCKAKREGCLPR